MRKVSENLDVFRGKIETTFNDATVLVAPRVVSKRKGGAYLMYILHVLPRSVIALNASHLFGGVA